MTTLRNENPLVSIIVVTYNSARFVIETLESAKAQTYQNLELIITDDCSTDITVKDCENWIAINGNRFVSAQIITSIVNTGISGNCNRGIKHATGTWLKLIAGDDALLENCVEDNVEFCTSHKNVYFLFSKGYTIDEKGTIIGNVGYWPKKMNLDSKRQYKEMLKRPYVLAPSSFINKEVMSLLGGFNETIKFLDDYPLWLKATREGYKLYFLDKTTILYRQHENSVMHKFHSKNDINKKRLWMETVIQLCDQTFLKDVIHFKMYSYYLLVVLQRKAFVSYLNGNMMQYRFFVLLKNLHPQNIYNEMFVLLKWFYQSFMKPLRKKKGNNKFINVNKPSPS